MKCPEAVEWMHRYLDHDLNEEESFLLFEHIRSCRDCFDAFELLNKLSARLEELPKVVPNFSLVDAILPQLDAIDRARREEGSTAEVVLPMTAANEAGTMPNRRSERSRAGEKALRRNRIYRFGSLGVAAALILGVFIYQYEPRTVSDAEIAMDTAAVQESQSLDSSQAADSANDAAGSAELFADGGSGGGAGGDQGEPASKTDGGAPAEAGNSGGANDRTTTGGSTDTVSPPARPDNSTGGAKSPSRQDTGTPDPASGNQGPANGGTPAKDPASPNAGSGQDPAGTETPDGQDQDVLNQRVADEEPKDKMYYGLAANLNVWASPDGKFEAELKDGHLYIYHIELQDRKLVSDQAIDGNWVSGAWSAEGNTFTYETEIDGTSAVRTIDAEKAAAAAAEGTQP
ncbi:zf-HC2 domain-containing protein [Paenibacillus macerans]|uniref:anti-sigma factor family protein n=1 Tax=Paenibacillus macerans TaxID=44252 RepID=UPI003D31C2B2